MFVIYSFALVATLLFTNGQPFDDPIPTTPMSYSPDCVDKLDTCWKMPHANCFAPYQEWAKHNCGNRCGYCIGPTTHAPLCMNNISNCEAYGNTVCTNKDYMAWAADNCRAWCRMCSPEENDRLDHMITTISPENCVDKLDCHQYGPNACSEKFKDWSKVNCPLHCNYCIGLPTPPPICEDKIPNCKAYNPDTCTNAAFRSWVEDNCKKFCGLCTDLPVINPNPQVVTSSGNTRIVPVKKRQFQGSHQHQGGTHACMDNTITDPFCQTSAPTAGPTTATTAPLDITTYDFPGSDIKPHPKPNPEWDSKPSITTIGTTATPNLNNNVTAFGSSLPHGTTDTNDSAQLSAIPTVVTSNVTIPIVGGGNGTLTVSSASTDKASTVVPNPNGSTSKTVSSSKDPSSPPTSVLISSSSVKVPPIVTISHPNVSEVSPSVTTINLHTNATQTHQMEKTTTEKSTHAMNKTQATHVTIFTPSHITSSPSSNSSHSTVSTKSTVTVPLTRSTTHGNTAPVQFTTLVSTENCADTVPNCPSYGIAACTQDTYRPWAVAHCPLFCGFCIPATMPPCKKDKLQNCHEYDSGNLCSSQSFLAWSHENCYTYCKYPGCTKTTTP